MIELEAGSIINHESLRHLAFRITDTHNHTPSLALSFQSPIARSSRRTILATLSPFQANLPSRPGFDREQREKTFDDGLLKKAKTRRLANCRTGRAGDIQRSNHNSDNDDNLHRGTRQRTCSWPTKRRTITTSSTLSSPIPSLTTHYINVTTDRRPRNDDLLPDPSVSDAHAHPATHITSDPPPFSPGVQEQARIGIDRPAAKTSDHSEASSILLSRLVQLWI